MKKLLLLSAVLVLTNYTVQAYTLTLNNQTNQNLNITVARALGSQQIPLGAGNSYNFPDILFIDRIAVSGADFGDIPGGMHEPQAVLRTLQNQIKTGIEDYQANPQSSAAQQTSQFLRNRTITFRPGRFGGVDIQTN